MRSNLTLLAAATVLVVGMTAAYAADNTAPGGTGVVQSTEGKGATNKDTSSMSGSGAGSMQSGGAATGMQPGTGVEESAQGEGATNKQGAEPMKGADNTGGALSGNAVGGTGVAASSQGEGSQNKN